MLREFIKSTPITYRVPQDRPGTLSTLGMVVIPNNLVLVHATISTTDHQGADFLAWKYNSETGKLIEAYDIYPNHGAGFLGYRYVTSARSGKLWAASPANGIMWGFKYANWAMAPANMVVDKKDPNFFIYQGPDVYYTHWKTVDGGPFLAGNTFAIDDLAKDGGIFLTSAARSLAVFNWKSGKEKYFLPMAGSVVNITLEGQNRVYVLLNNRTVVLVDYVRGEIMGAAKIPPQAIGSTWGGDGGLDPIFDETRIAWDAVHNRLLVWAETPDDAAGKATTCFRGYAMVSDPNRITTPIPLKVPRQGRVIPVLVQVVDDMNAGVGEYFVEATVTGAGSLAGMPITNFKGDALIQVACMGSPLHTGGKSPVDVGGGSGLVPAIGKPCWVGWFEFPPGVPLTYQPPGNCFMWVNHEADDRITDTTDTQFATWLQVEAGGTVEDMNAKIAATSGPAVVYWDARAWPSWPLLRTGDWLCLQAYCLVSETPEVFEANMRVAIMGIPPEIHNEVCLVCQCYTSNTSHTTDLIPLVSVFARLARDFSRVTMLLAFSDQGRDTGLEDHPEVLPYWQSLYEGVFGSPGGLSPFMASAEPEPFDFGSTDNASQLPPGSGTVTVTAMVRQVPKLTDTVEVLGPFSPIEPLPPGSGVGETAPNMSELVAQVYSARVWRLEQTWEKEPDGRGAFVEAVATALHDVDSRWGHLKMLKDEKHQYHQHSVTSVNFKHMSGPDTGKAELFDVVVNNSYGWKFIKKDGMSFNNWHYPAYTTSVN